MTCDLECFLDHCKEFGTSQDGSTCASNHANIDTSSTSNRDENICPTIDSLSFCQLERTVPDPENTSSNPELEKTFVISGDGKCSLDDFHLDVINQNPENISSKPSFQGKIEISGHGKGALDGCLLESNQLDPKSTSSKPGFQEAIGVSGHGHNSADSCQLERNKPDPKSISSKPVHGNSSQLEGQKCFTSDDEQVERNPSLQTADHSESSHEKSEMADLVETVGSNVELRNCFVKLMDVCKTSRSPERIHCKVCGKTFRLRAQLNAHLRSHSDEKPFKCDNCGKQCPQCFKCFRSSSFLQRHLSLHSKETAYACVHCGQKFDKGTVVPGENGEALKCKFCTKSFLRARYLRRHILTHTEVKPYRCKTCESCFSRYDHLKLHQARCRGKRQL
uniref:C2H2-type domain-containing protein n=1 Tax=Cyprinus carpio TaxID=7962 RepID=A0A8C1R968_CYPCA